MDKYFILEVFENDGKLSLKSQNDGFTAMEMYGFLEYKKTDIIKQLSGEVRPDVIKRSLVVD